MQLYKDPLISKATTSMWALKPGKYSVRYDDEVYSGSFKIADILHQNSANNCMIIVNKFQGRINMLTQQWFSCIDTALKDTVKLGQYIWH